MTANAARSISSVLLTLVIAAGCGSTGPAPTEVATPPPATATATPLATAIASVPASTAPAKLKLVGIGDSIPGAGDHDNAPSYTCDCTSFVFLWGDLASEALGKHVEVTNLATNDGVESGQLAERITHESRYRDVLAVADLITITIGTNDWQGPCGWPDDACWANGLETIPGNVGAILDGILELRAGKPTVIRLTTYFDQYIDFPGNLISGDPEASMPPDFLAFYRAEQAKFYGALCAEAEAREVVCVDIWTAFNGKGHDGSATALLLPDHVHPNQAGHELIAKTLDAAGYSPMQEAIRPPGA